MEQRQNGDIGTHTGFAGDLLFAFYFALSLCKRFSEHAFGLFQPCGIYTHCREWDLTATVLMIVDCGLDMRKMVAVADGDWAGLQNSG